MRISTWQDAELCVTAWMRLMGHLDARSTLSQADGLDIVSQTAVAQVRWRVAPASVIELRQFYESIANPQADVYYFSRAGYTDDALAWSGQVGMAAFRLAPDGTVEPVNDPARIALESVPPGAEPTWPGPDARPVFDPYRAPAAPAWTAAPPRPAAPIQYLYPEPPAQPANPAVPSPYLPATTQRSYQPVRYQAPGAPAFRTAPPRHPGRALRGWGIGLMIFGFFPVLILLLATLDGSPLPGALAVIVFYALFGIAGILMHRAGRRRRDGR